jgi:hypothetical protein
MILALTISFSAIWIPIILTIALVIFGDKNLCDESDGSFLGDFGLALLGIFCFICAPFIWTSYFTVLYFLK